MQNINFTDLRRLHIFDTGNDTYAFNPTTLRIAKLQPDEIEFIDAIQNSSQIHLESQAILSRIVDSNLFQSKIKVLSQERPQNDTLTPKRVEILVNSSESCNLMCDYCFVHQGRFNFDEQHMAMISVDSARLLVKTLPKALPWANEFCIHFYGGEPLLNLPAIKAAVETARDLTDSRFSFSITTNGTINTEESRNLLESADFSIVLSIDGPAPVHDAIRRTKGNKPTHSKVLNFLKHIREKGNLYVRASSVVRSGWSLQEATEYLKTLDVDTIKAQAIRVPSDHKFALNEIEQQQYIHHLKGIAEDVISCLRNDTTPIDDRFNSRVLQILRGVRRNSFCGAGKWTFGVTADGTVYPCVLLAGHDEFILGTLDASTCSWVARGREWAEIQGSREQCNECWAHPLCGGGCPAMLSVCGDDECELVRANCELALIIYSEFYPDNLEQLLNLSYDFSNGE